MELSYNGVAVVGTSMREINYPDGVSSIESLCVWRRSACLAVSGKAGGLYDRDLANSNVKLLLRNSSDSCSEIKRLCHYGDVIVFTDVVDRKVKTFDPRTITVETLMGTGKEGTNDGTSETCTFAQVHGICYLQNTIFVSDAAAGMAKIVSVLLAQCPSNPWKAVLQFWNWCSNRGRGITVPSRCCEQCFISE